MPFLLRPTDPRPLHTVRAHVLILRVFNVEPAPAPRGGAAPHRLSDRDSAARVDTAIGRFLLPTGVRM